MGHDSKSVPPGHALKLIFWYFRDCASREISERRKQGEDEISPTFAGYNRLCSDLKFSMTHTRATLVQARLALIYCLEVAPPGLYEVLAKRIKDIDVELEKNL